MATPLRMPDLGTVEGAVTLVSWLKAEGDSVALGEPLFEVETDKGVSEIEAAIAGVIVKLVIPAGGKAGPGELIAMIRRPGEPEETAEAPPEGRPATASTPTAAAPAAAILPTVVTPAAAGAVPPTIRALAARYGVELSAVRGSGPGGRILREDVLAARKGPGTGPAPLAAAAQPAPPAAPSRNQAAVARVVSQSHREKPTFHLTMTVDMSRVIEARKSAKPASIAFDAYLVKAVARAIASSPGFRRYQKDEKLLSHDAVDVAVAVSVDDDLYAPAIRRADTKSVRQIAGDIDALAAKARARAIGTAESEGSCFLVSNLGMFPVESFDAIVYPDHAAALAVGAAIPTPVSDGTRIWIAPLARLTLTVDHRLINGAVAARFLAAVKQFLESGDLS
ncbi:MAG TPA: 2-oxo acid dehydrogenase subunit E2 [Spirochaetia bacterium]|nr:2-oxo acid dehydrogenase subunit E2 [Spirochaetia bacterium]